MCACRKSFNLFINKVKHRLISPIGLSHIHIDQKNSNVDIKEFNDVFDEVLQRLTKNEENKPEFDSTLGWFKRVFEYNIPHGKKSRGITCVRAFKSFAKNPTKEDIHLSKILGWVMETYGSFLLMGDDIVDQSETRRGQLCWYKQKDVGLQALIDTLTTENAVYFILQKYFRNKACYMYIMELLIEITRKSILGQTLDGLMSSRAVPLDFSQFTFSRYATLIEYKTAYYSFVLPVASAMYFSGIIDDEIHKHVRPVLIKISHMFQVQDDYIDCYGNPAITGKIGTDITSGKCCWPIVTVLPLVTDHQRKVLMENYGKRNEKNEAKVKEIYNELALPSIFKKYEKECYDESVKAIKALPEEINTDIFYYSLNLNRERKR